MSNFKKHFVGLFAAACILHSIQAQPPAIPVKNHFIFSAIKGTVSKADSIVLMSTTGFVQMKWLTGDSSHFKTKVSKTNSGKEVKIILTFEPHAGFVGIARATMQLVKSRKTSTELRLTGLSTKGLEGENEPPLAQVIDALGYQADIGWKSLANHARPELMGEEVYASLFQKAGKGKVEITPVARYSPDFPLPFGYYMDEQGGPVKHQVGVLAKAAQYPEHQVLFPALDSGTTSFDPGAKAFGFYAEGSGHAAYSQDLWNILLHPAHAVHTTRIYPLKDTEGKIIKNTYLLCFEEAKNGDYNDYVFLVKNITAIKDNSFVNIFNGKDLTDWNTFLRNIGKNKDPNNNFRIKDSTIHVIGKDLGYMISEKGFRNYHFKVDFKWGVAKWPTRENEKRDAGICYNVPMNEPDSIWPQSIECQIQEGDTGDFWLLGFSTITVNGKTNQPMNHARMVKSKDAEKPYGEWNTVEVISYNGTCIHIVNGVEVNRGEKASTAEGRILLQSEFAEVYYRNVKIKQL